MDSWPAKDPDEVADYYVDWTVRLAEGETITSSIFTVVEGDVVKDSHDVVFEDDTGAAGTFAQVWLSGGSLGATCVVTNEVMTSGGRTWDKSMRLRIRSR